ncbi:polysaccharide deacetylase family protein [Novosphingopyxis sp.]|uniref:polysaccharide deacetylase family protein n=1 Tax=Novosphingopyxis sp. TaxID=2709690 RepID=UPI003B5AF00A
MKHLLLCIAAAWLLACAPASAQDQKRIALSFDDVPRAAGAFLTPDRRTVMLIAALDRAEVEQAVFFVNPAHLDLPQGAGGEDRIDAYVAAGHVIADHSNTHPHLNALSAAAYLADIDAAELWLKGRKGYRPWFRYPFLDEGQGDKAKRDAVRAGLAARGLGDAYVTSEASDWNMENLTLEANAAGKPIDREALRDLYVQSHVEAAEFYDGLMRRATGRSPVHVMLLHETDLAAMYIGDLVAALRAGGWDIVSADEAYADPVGQEATRYDTPSAQGTLTEMLAWQKGLPAPRWYDGNTIAVANRRFAERVLHEEAAPTP